MKALALLAAFLVLGVFTHGASGLVTWTFGGIDAALIAGRLNRGEPSRTVTLGVR